jgi:hypothetical protein
VECEHGDVAASFRADGFSQMIVGCQLAELLEALGSSKLWRSLRCILFLA